VAGIRLLVAGGGTAGHVLPAISVLEAAMASGYRAEELHYVGSTRGVEQEMVPPLGVPFTLLRVVGLQRRLTASNLLFAPLMVAAVLSSLVLLRRRRPAVVVSVGGYASLPPVLAARLLRIPVVVVSYDRRPGRASALSARFAAASAVAFPDSALPRATFTGAPLRRAILTADRVGGRVNARSRLGIDDDRFLVVALGGSLGSAALNAAVIRLVEDRIADRGLAVIHLAGRRFVDGLPDALDGSTGILYAPSGFSDEMATLYEAADVVIGRGGASTVHEVAAVGVPSVLVPWDGAAEDHQRENVRWLAESGGAVALSEMELGGLGSLVDELRADRARLDDLARRARELGEVSRSGRLSKLIDAVADGDT
jgi:UDP-N-acetylglucosamine:LPS N-acetylglucosamine transferase